MRRKSLMDRVRLMGRSAIDIVAVLGRSGIFLVHALLGRGGIGGGFQLLLRQLHSVGVMSLAIIVVSGVFIGMVLALQGFSILAKYRLRTGRRADGCPDACCANWGRSSPHYCSPGVQVLLSPPKSAT